MARPPSALVFAYHNVGVRCLRVLAAAGVEIRLVVTHADRPDETIWFDSVAATAAELGIPSIAPEHLDEAALQGPSGAEAPDFIFSFYYRQMLPASVLQMARRGAYNMHGSLLPKYRGRVPVNWAIIEGETRTGATLHEMVAKPDAGAIIGQTEVPILPDDTALEVFQKVTVAAEVTLWKSLPDLLAGSAVRRPNELALGSYFGGRRPEDGRIDWGAPAQRVYNLVRALAPPYPGAFCEVRGRRLVITRARLLWRGSGAQDNGPHENGAQDAGDLAPGLAVRDNRILGVCGDGGALLILRLVHDSREITPLELAALLYSS